MITGALAKKQSAVQLAKSLEAYLRPDIVQPDNWNDIYPDMPFVYKVDYNAKRLAVTSINHAGWGATISATRNNPYADYLHWELTPAHVINDVCDGYAAHDEGLGEGNWPIDAAPLPHPFCTCLWYVDTDKTLEEIGRELRAWEEGESNPRLDQAFGEWEERNGINFDMNFVDKPLDIKVMDGHIDDEVIQSVSDAIATVRADFPVLDCLEEVLFSEEETGFAAARNDGKALRANTSVFANMRTLKAAFDEAVKTGHTKNAENPMFVIAHELGHILHTQLALKRCGMKEIPLYGGMPAMVYNQSRQQIIINLFEHSIFTNENASEIYRAIWEEMGTRSRDSNDEMLAQAFGMYYYGQGSHPISDSFVKYMMQEFRR